MKKKVLSFAPWVDMGGIQFSKINKQKKRQNQHVFFLAHLWKLNKSSTKESTD